MKKEPNKRTTDTLRLGLAYAPESAPSVKSQYVTPAMGK